MKRKTVRKLVFIPLGTIVLLLGLAVGAAALLLTPERLTPLVSRVCDRYLDAQVRFDTVSVSLFRDFPYVTLRLRGRKWFRTLSNGCPIPFAASCPARPIRWLA